MAYTQPAVNRSIWLWRAPGLHVRVAISPRCTADSFWQLAACSAWLLVQISGISDCPSIDGSIPAAATDTDGGLGVGLSRGKVDTLFYLDRFLLRSVWEIAAEPSEYRAPHQDFGSCREIGAKTHWGSIRSHFCVRPAPRPADAKVTVAECTCTVYGMRTVRVQLCVLSFTRSIGTVYYGTAAVDPVQLYCVQIYCA